MKAERNKSIIIMIVYLLLSQVFLSCRSKSRQAEAVHNKESLIVEQSDSNSVDANVNEDSSKTEKEKPVSVSLSSSSHSIESSNYDNMRGFDPASEDDMDDNGMSRYMENNDEEGWD